MSTPPETSDSARSFLLFLGGLCVLVVAGVVLGSVFFGPPTLKQYDRSTPDALLEAARDMVVNGDAERLHELLYTDSDEMEALYARLGWVLGHLQDLAVAINDRFPEEVAAAREKAEAEARAGRGMSLFEQFGMGARRARRGSSSAGEGSRFNALVQTIATDPYAWLTAAEGRLRYVEIDDERVAVLWDDKPVFPPFGLVMRQDQGQWSVVLPLHNIPWLSSYMPQTPEEYSIWGSLLQMVDNVLVDLEADVGEGRLHSLDALARATGEKAVVPMGMGMIAYDRALKDRRKREREAREAAKAGKDGGG
ncbi:hypothetical protein MNBD_PLANCTO03-1078 [hydrothermal vent metagenome]|uniref:Uncharacterized protein n=1 Tax=hydrothermal vent metagenome TaxID=652676 RepID=A0A3B1DNC6_9ZZZZ